MTTVNGNSFLPLTCLTNTLFLENDDIEYPNYYNMKKILSESDVTENLTLPEGENRLKLSAHPNFDNSLVNLENSAVHIPVNVYDVS